MVSFRRIHWTERRERPASRASSAKRSRASACPKKSPPMRVRPRGAAPGGCQPWLQRIILCCFRPLIPGIRYCKYKPLLFPITRAEGINAERDAANLGHISFSKIRAKGGVQIELRDYRFMWVGISDTQKPSAVVNISPFVRVLGGSSCPRKRPINYGSARIIK
jgi:hypothetical protein